MSTKFDNAFPQPFCPATLIDAGIDSGERVNYVVSDYEWRPGVDFKSGRDIDLLVLKSKDSPEWILKRHQAKPIAGALGKDEQDWPGATVSAYWESTPVGDTVRVDQKRCK